VLDRDVLARLHRSSRVLAAQNQSETVFDEILRSAVESLGNGSATLYGWDRDAVVLRSLRSHGIPDSAVPPTLEPGRTLAGAVAQQGRPLSGAEDVAGGGRAAALAVPLARAGVLMGVLLVRAGDGRTAFTEDDSRILTLFGDQAVGILWTAAALEEQRIAKLELERLERAKSDLIAMLNHEFRTPLMGIQGFSELLRDETLSPGEIKEYASDINKDANRLTGLIAEMIEADLMETGQLHLELEVLDLNAIVREESATVERTSGYRVTLALDETLAPVHADRQRLGEMVRSLLESAIAYSDDSTEIWAATRGEGGVAHLVARDRGEGLPPELLERIFDRYARIDPTATRHLRGSGIALPIVRQIAILHGGRAWAESTPGDGSSFHVTIPVVGRSG
jgi:signal transduction histidine kinase